jgi:phosphoribulokinase/uridine kinase family protein
MDIHAAQVGQAAFDDSLARRLPAAGAQARVPDQQAGVRPLPWRVRPAGGSPAQGGGHCPGPAPVPRSRVLGLFDLNVWLDPEEELKHGWKVQRDVAKRGYTREQVRPAIAAGEPDVAAYIPLSAVSPISSSASTGREAATAAMNI